MFIGKISLAGDSGVQMVLFFVLLKCHTFYVYPHDCMWPLFIYPHS